MNPKGRPPRVGLDDFDKAILKTAAIIRQAKGYPSCKKIGSRLNRSFASVRVRIARLKTLDLWPYEVHFTHHAVNPECREMILKMAEQPRATLGKIIYEIEQLTGRSLNKKSVKFMLKKPIPRRAHVMEPMTDKEVLRRAAEIRNQRDQGRAS